MTILRQNLTKYGIFEANTAKISTKMVILPPKLCIFWFHIWQCFQKVKNHEGTLALVQGFGLTESGKQSGELLQTHVTVISNEKCAEILTHNISSNLIDYHKLTKPSSGSLKYGITDEIMCTLGIEDPDTGSISVRKLF